MKQKLWITLITYLAYCIDRELYKAIDYLREQVRVLIEQQENDKRILLDNRQRIRLAAKAKRLTRRLLEETTVLFTPDTVQGTTGPSEGDCAFVGRRVVNSHSSAPGAFCSPRHLKTNTLESLCVSPNACLYLTGRIAGQTS